MKAHIIEASGNYEITSIILHIICECGEGFFIDVSPGEPFKCPRCGRVYNFWLEYKLKKWSKKKIKEFKSLRGRKIKVGVKTEEFYKELRSRKR